MHKRITKVEQMLSIPASLATISEIEGRLPVDPVREIQGNPTTYRY
jgi:hypothetical protein